MDINRTDIVKLFLDGYIIKSIQQLKQNNIKTEIIYNKKIFGLSSTYKNLIQYSSVKSSEYDKIIRQESPVVDLSNLHILSTIGSSLVAEYFEQWRNYVIMNFSFVNKTEQVQSLINLQRLMIIYGLQKKTIPMDYFHKYRNSRFLPFIIVGNSYIRDTNEFKIIRVKFTNDDKFGALSPDTIDKINIIISEGNIPKFDTYMNYKDLPEIMFIRKGNLDKHLKYYITSLLHIDVNSLKYYGNESIPEWMKQLIIGLDVPVDHFSSKIQIDYNEYLRVTFQYQQEARPIYTVSGIIPKSLYRLYLDNITLTSSNKCTLVNTILYSIINPSELIHIDFGKQFIMNKTKFIKAIYALSPITNNIRIDFSFILKIMNGESQKPIAFTANKGTGKTELFNMIKKLSKSKFYLEDSDMYPIWALARMNANTLILKNRYRYSMQRFAVVMPNLHGKTYLAQKYPDKFIDVDTFLPDNLLTLIDQERAIQIMRSNMKNQLMKNLKKFDNKIFLVHSIDIADELECKVVSTIRFIEINKLYKPGLEDRYNAMKDYYKTNWCFSTIEFVNSYDDVEEKLLNIYNKYVNIYELVNISRSDDDLFEFLYDNPDLYFMFDNFLENSTENLIERSNCKQLSYDNIIKIVTRLHSIYLAVLNSSDTGLKLFNELSEELKYKREYYNAIIFCHSYNELAYRENYQNIYTLTNNIDIHAIGNDVQRNLKFEILKNLFRKLYTSQILIDPAILRNLISSAVLM